MCKCNPKIRQPYCGKPGCEWPIQKPYKTEEELRNILLNRGVQRRYLDAKLSDYDEWVQQYIDKGLFICGPVGSGKTHLLCALLRNDIDSDRKSWIVTVPKLLSELKNTFGESDKTEKDVLDFYSEMPHLYLDDLGAEKVTDWAFQCLYLILDNRYGNMKRTVISSNKTLRELRDVIGERLVSRIVGMCGKEESIVGRDRRMITE